MFLQLNMRFLYVIKISSGEKKARMSFVTWCNDLKNLRNKDSYEEPALMIMDVMISFLIEP